MSYRASQFNKRLDSVEDKIRPIGSFAYRLASLSDSDKEGYYAFRAELKKWADRFYGEELYFQILAIVEGVKTDMPQLAPRIHIQLYPPAKFTDPREIYEELKESMR